jgi:hypothetical protein
MRKPTVIGSTNSAPTKSADSKPVHANTKYAPSIIPGTIRQGLVIELASLAKQFPTTPAHVLSLSARTLKDTIFSTLTEEQCAQWGCAAQQAYNAAIDACLEINASVQLQTCMRYVQRLRELLTDLAKSLQDSESTGFLFWKSSPDAAQLLAASRAELLLLRQHLMHALPEIRGLQLRLQRLSVELLALCDALDSYAISSVVMADKFAELGHADRRAQTLMQQSRALIQTMAHIQSSAVLRQSSQFNLDQLIQTVQDTVMVELPAWLETISLALHAKQITQTQRYALSHQLEIITKQLK